MKTTQGDNITFLEQMRTSEGYALIEARLKKMEADEIESMINAPAADPLYALMMARHQEVIQTVRALLRLPEVLIAEEQRKFREQ